MNASFHLTRFRHTIEKSTSYFEFTVSKWHGFTTRTEKNQIMQEIHRNDIWKTIIYNNKKYKIAEILFLFKMFIFIDPIWAN